MLQFQYFSDTTLILDRYYSVTTPILLRYYFVTISILLRYYSDTTRILLQYHSDTIRILLRYYYILLRYYSNTRILGSLEQKPEVDLDIRGHLECPDVVVSRNSREMNSLTPKDVGNEDLTIIHNYPRAPVKSEVDLNFRGHSDMIASRYSQEWITRPRKM